MDVAYGESVTVVIDGEKHEGTVTDADLRNGTLTVDLEE